MPTERIQFGVIQESSNEELSGAAPLAINVIVDGRGTVRRRPGIKTWADAGTAVFPGAPIVAMAEYGDVLYFVAEAATGQRKIGKLTGGVQTSLSPDASATLTGTGRPVIATFNDRLMFAGGSTLMEVGTADTITAANAVINDANALGGDFEPPLCTYVDAFSGYAFVNDLTSDSTLDWVRPSSTVDYNGLVNFDPLDVVQASARPDQVIALANNANEFYVFGERTLQIFVADEASILAPARTIELGISAPYSLVPTQAGFSWLDSRKRLMQTDGRSDSEVGLPIRRTLSKISTVSDCWGFYAPMGHGDFYGWVFPSDGRTFVMQEGAGWAQWHSGVGQQALWLPKSYYYWENQGVHVVGMADGTFAQLDLDTNTDLGAAFEAKVRTGFESHKTSAFKTCKSLRLRIRRLTTSASGTLRLSWRDNLGAFSPSLAIDISTAGEYEPVVQFRGLGTYRQRQWQIDLTDSVGLSISDVEEDFDIV